MEPSGTTIMRGPNCTPAMHGKIKTNKQGSLKMNFTGGFIPRLFFVCLFLR